MSVRMRGFEKYSPLGAALKLVLSHVRPLPPESVPFQNTVGRVLAEDVVAESDSPPFRRSTMDGFAVRASDTFGAGPSTPVALNVVGSVRSGFMPKASVGRKEALKIMTGAPVPKGADAVVMVEHTKLQGRRLEVLLPVTPGKNTSERGEDIKAGEVVLKKGHVIHPQDVGMFAQMQNLGVRVFRRPKVAVATTGEELVAPGRKLPPAKIVDSNSYSLAAAVTAAGGVPQVLGIAPDDRQSIKKLIQRSLGHDMVLLSGGSSVGEFDLVPEIISEMGKMVFHGVSIRPGGPTAFGVIKKKPVFCLAGFPVATLVAFHLLVRPALLAMQELPPDHGRRAVTARLTKDVSGTLGRMDVVRVRVRKAREWLAEPLMVGGSSLLSSMTGADGFITVPEDIEGLNKGQKVEVELY
ncbi:MAG: gephyrin-like molybdotransferase Glp [Candidatus Hadarchaeota archaeon]